MDCANAVHNPVFEFSNKAVAGKIKDLSMTVSSVIWEHTFVIIFIRVHAANLSLKYVIPGVADIDVARQVIDTDTLSKGFFIPGLNEEKFIFYLYLP